VVGWQRQLSHAQQRVVRLNTVRQHQQQRWQQELVVQQTVLQGLCVRYVRFCQENAQQAHPPRCTIRTDAGFASGENLTALIELGYDVETKSVNPAILAALRSRVTPETAWTQVGQNAEMVAWTGYHSHTCPYLLTVGVERFHTPQGELHAVLVRYQDEAEAAVHDLVQWFHDYNGRQTVEMVCSQIIKRALFSLVGSRDHVADLDLIVVDEHAINEQFYQLPALGEVKCVERRLEASTKVIDVIGELGDLDLLLGLGFQLP
jgi:hypothetical protein